MRHRAVHQQVRADEVEHAVRQLPRVLDTRARPRLRHLAARHRQPCTRARLLLLELGVEGRADVVNVEGADAGAQEAIEVGGWWSMAAVLNGAYRSVLQTRMKLNRIILCLISVRPVLIEKKYLIMTLSAFENSALVSSKAPAIHLENILMSF